MQERPGLRELAPVSLNARGCSPALGAWSRIYNLVSPAPALVARPARAGAAAAGHQGCFLLLLLESPTSPKNRLKGKSGPRRREGVLREGVLCEEAPLPTFKS